MTHNGTVFFSTLPNRSIGWSTDYLRLVVQDILKRAPGLEQEKTGKEFQTLSSIPYKGKNYIFNDPVGVTVEKTDDGYFLELKKLDIDLFAESKSELQDLLGESVDYIWNTFCRRPDSDFDESGKKFKHEIENLIRLN